MVSYHTIQSFDHPCTLNMFISIESCQTQIHIHIDSQLTNDDSNEEVLETFSNLLPTFGQKIFLNHLGLRIHRMRSPLTRSDRFHVDQLTSFIHNPSYSEHPVHDLIIMIGYEPKYGFICTRFHGGVRSKDHLHYSHLENHLLTFK